MGRSAAAALVIGAALFSQGAHAAPILAGPGDAAYDAKLAALGDGFQRQQDAFATLENGLSLDVYFDEAEIPGVRAFFAQTDVDDFETFSGKHPFDVVTTFEEWGDEGNFAGISSVGVAARLMVLEAEGAPAADIARARAAAVRAARTWHVFGAIGGPGVVARGVRRVVPEDASDPPLPATLPDLTPEADGSGAPLPADKQPTWRAPVAKGFDDWIWIDDTSKDQVSGYALAVAWLWDALKDEPGVPAEVTQDLASDLVAFAKALTKVAPELGIDLCIRDADGRLTSFHDLNPQQITPDAVLPPSSGLSNGFNATLALGVVRAAYHVSGDPVIGRYYYDELVGARDLPGSAAGFTSLVYTGPATNYSNVNMLAIGLATLGRFETDPGVRAAFATELETQFWSAGGDRDAEHVQQAWFDVIYGAFSTRATADITKRMTRTLGAFQPAPAIERDVVNCDDDELAAGVCTAVDGATRIELESTAGHNGIPVAKDALPMSIRPDSDFEWRSDPHRVNGSASTLMDPRGDWLTAYWLGRLLELAKPDANLSPRARPPLAYTQGAGGGGAGGASPTGEGGAGGAPDDTTPAGASDDGGCSCRAGGEDAPAGALWVTAAIAAAAIARRRRA